MMQGRCDVTKTGETKELGGLEKPVGQEQSGQSVGGAENGARGGWRGRWEPCPDQNRDFI